MMVTGIIEVANASIA